MILCKVKHHHYNHRRASVEPTLSQMKTNLFNNTAKDALKLTSQSLFESRDRSYTTCVKLCVNTHKQKNTHTKTHTNTHIQTHTHKHKHTHTNKQCMKWDSVVVASDLYLRNIQFESRSSHHIYNSSEAVLPHYKVPSHQAVSYTFRKAATGIRRWHQLICV